MKKAVFITVRSKSTRLPRKCFIPIEGIPTITHLIRRIKSGIAGWPVLCTTTRREDKKLTDIAADEGILFFQGKEDKLERWLAAAKAFGVEFFVTADGDDILQDPELIDRIFWQYDETGSDFIYPPSNIICGAVGYGIKVSALEKVCEVKDTNDTEMMWVYFTDTKIFRCEELRGVPFVYLRPEIRMTLDYAEDLQFFKEVFGHMYKQHYGPRHTVFNLRNVVALLDKYPYIMKINHKCQKLFLDNQKKKTRLVLKDEYKPKQVSRK